MIAIKILEVDIEGHSQELLKDFRQLNHLRLHFHRLLLAPCQLQAQIIRMNFKKCTSSRETTIHIQI
uniref:Putative ovule protein n=1 Tax=Solanum chacoense TaxID=4108 RepID=A0A0V0GTS5_SOLCH